MIAWISQNAIRPYLNHAFKIAIFIYIATHFQKKSQT